MFAAMSNAVAFTRKVEGSDVLSVAFASVAVAARQAAIAFGLAPQFKNAQQEVRGSSHRSAAPRVRRAGSAHSAGTTLGPDRGATTPPGMLYLP